MTLPNNMLVIDFETNGAKLPNGKMDEENQVPVEVCAVRMHEGEIVGMFNTLIKYEGEWTEALQNGHHSADDLRKGMDIMDVSHILLYMLPMNGVVAAYNVLFDTRIVYNMLEDYVHVSAGDDFLSNTALLCPLTIARARHIKGGHKLTDMLPKYGISIEDAHTAHDDTMALVELVQKMDAEEDVTKWVNTIGYKRQYGEPAWKPNHIELLPQGHETVYHRADGSTNKQTNVGKPFQRVVMGKPVARPQPGK
jgi:DNA polymerase III epsilon subunit-like protein